MERLITDIEQYFKAPGAEDYHIHVSRYPRDGIIFVKKYLQQSSRPVRVYSVGGDGITYDCLNGIIGFPKAELALMPYGEGIDFIRAFGENLFEEFRTLDLQVRSPSIGTDVIRCNNHYALNYCAVGLEAAAAVEAAALFESFRRLRRLLRPLNAPFSVLGGVLAMIDRKGVGTFTLDADGEDLSGDYNNFVFANGPRVGITRSLMSATVPNDGILEMLGTPRIGLLKQIGYYMQREFQKLPRNTLYRRVKKVSLRSDSPLYISLDGEVLYDSDITIEVVPAAVKVAAVNGREYKARRAL
jgi:diacylglycerol kinase family enzyme